ncbi:hypothetical protein OIO90_006135 [Microbotryomycetes sp. JL221]|nr:hypothetical protein OIO90_006135 [Microbotryomycetes sp. JL221]
MAAKNSVDAHRKQQRKKELQRNKQNRQKQKEISIVKKDTRPIELEIRQLSQHQRLSKDDRDQLESLKAELSRINKAKNEYVEKHPEHRKFVFPDRPDTNNTNNDDREPPGLFTKDGKLKHPERSIYYDPVFNPFGVPPPGMPYRERPPNPDELAAFEPHVDQDENDEDEDSDGDDEGDDDDDIALPPGPPPPAGASNTNDDEEDTSDSDAGSDLDGIVMPDGPPPLEAQQQANLGGPHRVQISRPSTSSMPYPPPPTRGGPGSFRGSPHRGAARGSVRGRGTAPYRPTNGGPPTREAHAAIQDPLSDEPHKTFQSVQHERWQQRHQQQSSSQVSNMPNEGPSLVHPSSTSSSSSPFLPIGAASSTNAPNATISAAPQLRDLKKEATAFIPTHMRRKQQQQQKQSTRSTNDSSVAGQMGLNRINATAGESNDSQQQQQQQMNDKPNLMNSLKQVGIGQNNESMTKTTKDKKQSDDFAMFERDMAEFL